jgi:hypothetical protein
MSAKNVFADTGSHADGRTDGRTDGSACHIKRSVLIRLRKERQKYCRTSSKFNSYFRLWPIVNSDEKTGVITVTSTITWRLCRESLDGSFTYYDTCIRWSLGVHFNMNFNLFYNQTISKFSQVPADTGLLFSKVPVFRDTIKWTPVLQKIAPALLVISLTTVTQFKTVSSAPLCRQLQHNKLICNTVTSSAVAHSTASLNYVTR